MADELTPEQEAIVAEAIAQMKDVPTAGVPYVPPSNTVVRTRYDGWYYVEEPYAAITKRVQEVLEVIDGPAFLEFSVVGNEATKVCVRFDTITAIIDLTPKAAEE